MTPLLIPTDPNTGPLRLTLLDDDPPEIPVWQGTFHHEPAPGYPIASLEQNPAYVTGRPRPQICSRNTGLRLLASRPKQKNPNRAGTDARKRKDGRYETRVTLNIPAGCRRLSLYVAPAEEANNKKFQALADQAKGILFSYDEDHKRALLATSFEIRSPFLVGPASQVSWVKGARRALPRLPTVKFGRGEAFKICR